MWLRTLFDSVKHRRSGTPVRRKLRQETAGRLRLEALEDRCLPSFSPAVSYPLGGGNVFAGDLNGDYSIDLFTGGIALLNNGDGTFSPGGFSDIAPYALADFNGDGRSDAVSPGDLQAGNGDGTFQPGRAFHLTNPSNGTLAVGDVNNDGNPDVVAGWQRVDLIFDDQGNWGVFFVDGADVFLGDGAGALTFSSSIEGPSSQSSSTTSSLVLADFNGDGRIDIVEANAPPAGSSYYEGGLVLLGNGDGSFQPGPSFWNNADIRLAVDFDGDNRPDVARLGNVQLGNGDGTFQSPQSYSSPGAVSLAARDFNGDGRLDLVTSHPGDWDSATGEYVGGYVSVLLGNGNGTFQTGRDFTAGAGPWSLAVADFNGDARPDLAVGNASSADVSVLLNDGNWTVFPPSITINDVTFPEGNAGITSAVFTVSLTNSYYQPVTVAYATADGTATAGGDYQSTSDTLIFAPGETSTTVTVLVSADRLPEPNETFFVNLNSPANASVADSQGVGAIVDDEPHVSISDVTKREGRKSTTSFIFTVTLSTAYDQPVTVSYKTTDGTAKTSDSDYVAKTGTLTFNPGETSKTITITVNGDDKKEANETFYLDLFGLSGNSLFTKSRGLGTILNDD